MKIKIESQVFERYPDAKVGFLLAKVKVTKTDPMVEERLENLEGKLTAQGINATTFVTHPKIAIWREMFQKDFHVKPKTYRSSLESLLKRLLTGKKLWQINTIVDLYNCISVETLFPMGGYDMQKIDGDIVVRYAKEHEEFIPLGSSEKVACSSKHIVYADDQDVLCWLWNHKDAKKTAITEETEEVIFFFDAVNGAIEEVQVAIDKLQESLEHLENHVLMSGILHHEIRETHVLSAV